MLDEPHRFEAEPVGKLDLLERFVEHPPLVAVGPGSWHLVLIEEAEPHIAESNMVM
jgi:hypothetical protein